MAEAPLEQQVRGKEVHYRLETNDLLESGKKSLTVVGGERRWWEYRQYQPESLTRKIVDGLAGRGIARVDDPRTVVVVLERDGALSADDARYIEWLAGQKREYPKVLMISTGGRAPATPTQAAAPKVQAETYWQRQWLRLKAIPAPVTRDAALAAIPRTAIPVLGSLGLGLLKIHEVPFERTLIYTGLAFGFAIGFALFNQSVMNYNTFCSELTRESCEPMIKGLERRLSSGALSRLLINALSFVSARGDVLITGPTLGVGCTFLARLALGAVGETQSVMTFLGFLTLVGNVLVGSFAGGPYGQVLAHLRSVGKITNKATMYLGIVETIKMELGRLADFGMQTLYNSLQGFVAVFFWAMLLVVDRCYRKPEVVLLSPEDDSARRLFESLRSASAVPAAGLAVN